MVKSDFFEDVYAVVKLIPAGRVTSYGAISSYLGAKQGARMVGWALGHSHSAGDIPAHRVLNRDGRLTGKLQFTTPTLMEERLGAEGVAVVNDRVVEWNKLFWDPMLELL
ncbi:methylated-DNA-protein-cysteine methyltransferase-like protein [Dyadobacter jejuensis]|uniref:Methylated-DNA-protein-cysteine methyltransferase-like protein n=1 Tax=Dyadobacter jejuensis TaxID=1082580 RepID=A0A316A9D0_9BACT|nr:MGMT family protein [Dyadobacter jejuensis]PWJ54526.1 methylated-DNA-protein-cysteine methyltransferase-like protein [Dyadobacter jejuensis]